MLEVANDYVNGDWDDLENKYKDVLDQRRCDISVHLENRKGRCSSLSRDGR